MIDDSSREQPIGQTPWSASRRRWARHLIAGQTVDRPMYGSPAWVGLPSDHPDKIAACVVAAECWACDGDKLEDDLRREIEGLRRGHKLAEDQEYQESVRRGTGYTPPSQMKSFRERRAAQIDGAAPQLGDYMGGPVEWSPGGDGA